MKKPIEPKKPVLPLKCKRMFVRVNSFEIKNQIPHCGVLIGQIAKIEQISRFDALARVEIQCIENGTRMYVEYAVYDMIPNTQYKKELSKYEKDKKSYPERLKKYKEKMKEYRREQEIAEVHKHIAHFQTRLCKLTGMEWFLGKQ